MTNKQYLEAVDHLLDDLCNLAEYYRDIAGLEIQPISEETERRLLALKAQEDNIKSDMWEEK